jgi:hypothetical protein
MEISFDRRNVSQCLQQRFTLPTYQRDYKWEAKHMLELLTDIQETFFAQYRQEHGRGSVAKYGPYFLGTIITTPSSDGQKAIVDGQQRITTLALIIAYFCRLAKGHDELNISDLTPLLRRKIFGGVELNIGFQPTRAKLFELLVDHPKLAEGDSDSLQEAVYGIANLDEGSERLFELYLSIESYISDEIDQQILPFFIDYLTECVQLFEIGVPGEQDGHKVFVTMNDRGLKLGPIDLLKGFLLSNIPDNDGNIQAHHAWNEAIKRLKQIGPDEDSTFFKAWLRAQYATTIRGKQKGATPGDFEQIGDGYHRWVVDNRAVLGLRTADDFFNFVTSVLPTFVSHYCTVKKAEMDYAKAYPHVFFNASRDFTLQSMLVLAAINPSEQHSDVARKIRLVSYFVDYFATHRVISGQDNTYNNVRDPVFAILKQVRGSSVATLAEKLKAEAARLAPAEFDLGRLMYWSMRTSDLLHLLARFAEYLEETLELTNKVGFPNYISRVRGVKTFDIEHMLSGQYKDITDKLAGNNDFGGINEFRAARGQLGALILLTRGRNRSLQDKPYENKLPVYATECVLAQTLSASFYSNNPRVVSKLSELGLTLEPFEFVNQAVISKRLAAYKQISQRIWSLEAFDTFAK